MLDYFKISKFFLFISVLGVGLVTTSTLFPFIVGKYAWFRGTIGLAALAFALGLFLRHDGEAIWQRLKEIFRRPLVIAVSVFVAAFLLACVFGVDPAFSFWSNFERGEGGFQILTLYAFFLMAVVLLREEKDWRRFMSFALAGAVLAILYGIGAGWHLGRFIGPGFSDPGLRFYGSIGNPAYLATYLIFVIGYCLYLIFSGRKNRKPGQLVLSSREIGLSALAIFFFVFFLLANTRGGFIGLFASLFGVLVFIGLARKNWRKKLLIAAVILILVLVGLIFFRDSPFVQELPFARLFDLSVFTETFQHRVIMWKIAVQGWLERPLFGWGPENYLNIFDRHFDPDYFTPGEQIGAWFDRAHSVYFDYLAETGAVGLLSYLGIFAVYYWLLFWRFPAADKESIFVKAWLFALPIAYLVQGLVLFEVLVIYQQLFLLLAFAVYKFGAASKSEIVKSKP